MNLPNINENQFWILFWFMLFITLICIVLIIGVASTSGPEPTAAYETLRLELGYCAALGSDDKELECFKLVMNNVPNS